MSFHFKTNRKISQFIFDKIFTNSFTEKIKVYHLILATFMIPGVFAPSFAQESDSVVTTRELKGAVTVTNYEISMILTFMSGNLAVMDIERTNLKPPQPFEIQDSPKDRISKNQGWRIFESPSLISSLRAKLLFSKG